MIFGNSLILLCAGNVVCLDFRMVSANDNWRNFIPPYMFGIYFCYLISLIKLYNKINDCCFRWNLHVLLRGPVDRRSARACLYQLP